MSTLWEYLPVMPKAWDGIPIIWTPWSDAPRMFVCGRWKNAKASTCEGCGVIGGLASSRGTMRTPPVEVGRKWAPRQVAALHAMRCRECGYTTVTDINFKVWVLGPEDYGPSGSHAPIPGRPVSLGPDQPELF